MEKNIVKNMELLFVELAAVNPDGYVCLNIDYLLIFNKIMYTSIIRKAFLLIASEDKNIHADGEDGIFTVFKSMKKRFELPFYQEDDIIYVFPSIENIFEIQEEHTEDEIRDIHLLALLINAEVNRFNSIPSTISGYLIYREKEKRRNLWKN